MICKLSHKIKGSFTPVQCATSPPFKSAEKSILTFIFTTCNLLLCKFTVNLIFWKWRSLSLHSVHTWYEVDGKSWAKYESMRHVWLVSEGKALQLPRYKSDDLIVKLWKLGHCLDKCSVCDFSRCPTVQLVSVDINLEVNNQKMIWSSVFALCFTFFLFLFFVFFWNVICLF